MCTIKHCSVDNSCSFWRHLKAWPSILEMSPHFWKSDDIPQKWSILRGKNFFFAPSKNFTLIKWVGHVLFAKKMKIFCQMWPRQPLKHFTAAYRGFPPCTQSQYPTNRETGYSNVLSPERTEITRLLCIHWTKVDLLENSDLGRLWCIRCRVMISGLWSLLHMYFMHWSSFSSDHSYQ